MQGPDQCTYVNKDNNYVSIPRMKRKLPTPQLDFSYSLFIIITTYSNLVKHCLLITRLVSFPYIKRKLLIPKLNFS